MTPPCRVAAGGGAQRQSRARGGAARRGPHKRKHSVTLTGAVCKGSASFPFRTSVVSGGSEHQRWVPPQRGRRGLPLKTLLSDNHLCAFTPVSKAISQGAQPSETPWPGQSCCLQNEQHQKSRRTTLTSTIHPDNPVGPSVQSRDAGSLGRMGGTTRCALRETRRKGESQEAVGRRERG